MDDVDLLIRLLSISSPSGKEEEAVDFFCEAAETLGYHTSVDAAGNGIAETGQRRPKFMFLGHIDTADGFLKPMKRDGRIFGRGAVDAKGPLATALWGLANLPDDVKGSACVVAAVGEESDSRGARSLLKSRPPDFMIAGEPSGWDCVVTAYKGRLRLRASLTTPLQHPSSPHPDALSEMVRFASDARRACEGLLNNSVYESAACRVADIRRRESSESLTAEATLDIRFPASTSDRKLIEVIESVRGDVHVSLEDFVPPVQVEKDNIVCRALLSAIRAEGGVPKFKKKAGTSDMNLAAARWSIPMSSYGPGDPKLGHSAQEFLDAEEYRLSQRVLRFAATKLLS